MRKRRTPNDAQVRILRDVRPYCLSVDQRGHGFTKVERTSREVVSVDRQKMLGYVDEAVEMTPEQFEYITERLKRHTFSHERISTSPSGKNWLTAAQRLFQQREQRLNELTRRRHG